MDDKHVINCNDVPEIDMTRQDGGLEHKAGVYTYQIRRSCRTDGDYTYNHAPMLTAFNNRVELLGWQTVVLYRIHVGIINMVPTWSKTTFRVSWLAVRLCMVFTKFLPHCE